MPNASPSVALVCGSLLLAVAGCSRARPAAPSTSSQPVVTLYFVALNPAHPAGEPIGCGDLLVSERRTIDAVSGPAATSSLEAAIRAQLTAKPPAGLVNPLANLHVALRSVAIDGRHATVVLEPFSMGGECDNPRIDAQLTHVSRQFRELDAVDLFVGDRTLAQYLSLR